MDYKFQKVYTLIAQTPMIHFQHDQTGATLRATEVKPKMDQYLWKCAEDEKIDKKQLELWSALVSDCDEKTDMIDPNEKKSHRTFHYKMRIERKGRPTDSQITMDNCKFYFGNQGDGDKKELVFNNCSLQIICFIPELLKFIDAHIGTFFALHNFGTRQTKGFGGFRINGQTDEEIEQAVKNSGKSYFYADVPDSDRDSVKNRFDHALTVYSVMKNGLNMARYNEGRGTYRAPQRYIKGFAMRPYLDKVSKNYKIGSDKAFIKSKVHSPLSDDNCDAMDRNYEGYTFIRALLGLAEQYEFRDRYRNNGVRVNPNTHKSSYNPVGVALINCPKNEDGSPKIEPNQCMDDLKKETKIQKFASPVTIKIYNNRIYFLFDDSYKKMLNQMFLFLSFSKDGRRTSYESISNCLSSGHYLSTPKDFDMKAFIENFVSHYNDTVKLQLRSFEDPYVNSRNLTLQKGW